MNGKYIKLIILILLLSYSIFYPGSKGVNSCYQAYGSAALDVENYNGGFFTIDKPAGWDIYTAGSCATFSFLIIDPKEPLRQIFHFGQVGPVYLYAEQKQIDMNYMNMGGYPVTWIDMPVINPLTPSTFMENFQYIARTNIAQSFMPNLPILENLVVISSAPQNSFTPEAATELIRAIFVKDGRLAEGLFMVSTAPLLAYNGGPGGGIGYGFLLTGVTAPKEEFKNIEDSLIKCAASFYMNQDYINQCLRAQNTAYEGILKAGRTLSEASDIITRGWEARNRTDDIISEKRSDAIMGRERLYDPSSGDVYEFENGFYDNYDTRREKYEMNNLKRLPDDDYELWTRAPLDGSRNLR